MAQKVIAIGTSIGVVLPKALVEKNGIALGQEVEVSADGLDRWIIERKSKRSHKADADLVKWAANYVEKYRKDFEALADK